MKLPLVPTMLVAAAVAVIAPVGSVKEKPRRTPEEALAHFESMVGHAPVPTEGIRESMGRSRCD